jgi:hypothetical protein
MRLVLRGTISPEDRRIEKSIDCMFRRARRIRRIRNRRRLIAAFLKQMQICR